MIRKRVIVRGHVQGVGFRWAAQAEAETLGVAGYVRNLPDGTVQAELEGTESAVKRMLDWLHHGPQHADVHGVDITDLDTTDEEHTDHERDGSSAGNRFRIR
jgi:acylphosphatase